MEPFRSLHGTVSKPSRNRSEAFKEPFRSLQESFAKLSRRLRPSLKRKASGFSREFGKDFVDPYPHLRTTLSFPDFVTFLAPHPQYAVKPFFLFLGRRAFCMVFYNSSDARPARPKVAASLCP
jgi:hypothetical protein